MRDAPIVLAFVLAGCQLFSRSEPPDAATSDGGPTYPALRPGVAPLPCALPLLGFAVDGDRVVVASRQTSAGGAQLFAATVCVSEDRARSFRAITIPEDDLGELDVYGLAAGHGRAWLLLADEVWVGTLLRASTLVARSLDLTDGALGDPIALRPGAVHVSGDALTTFQRSAASAGEVRGTFTRFDLATGAVAAVEVAGSIGECLEPPFGGDFQTHDGDAWMRTCYRDLELCVQRAVMSQARLDEVCSTYPDWPIPWRQVQEDAVLEGALAHLRHERGHVLARDLLPEGGAPALGPEREVGVAMNVEPTSVAGALRISDGTVTRGAPPHRRWVATHTSGWVPITPSPSPCTDDAACGRLVPPQLGIALDAGDWLFAHASVELGVFVEVVHEGDGDPGPFALPATFAEDSGGDWILEQPAESALERACALATSCDGGQAVHPLSCIDYWELVRGAGPAADRAYERFVGTRSCADLPDTFPALFATCAARCLPDGRAISCDPDGLHSYVAAAFHRVRECADFGASCVVTGESAGCVLAGVECGECDASGRLARCEGGLPDMIDDCASNGLVCEARAGGGAGCRHEPRDVFSALCEGSVFRELDEAGYEITVRDCSRANMPCNAPRGCFDDPSVDGVDYCDLGFTDCVGTRMRWVNPTEPQCGWFHRWVDCLDLGATGCAAGRCTFP